MSISDTASSLSTTPHLADVAQWICKKSPFQKKAIARYLESPDPQFLAFAEDWVRRLEQSQAPGVAGAPELLADAYVAYTKMIRVEEMHFLKSKSYRYSDYAEVYQRVYSQNAHMRNYCLGLGLTQIFWPNHYQIVRFFLDQFIPTVKQARQGVEIGVGHGLFHSELLRGAPGIRTTMLDVSPVSLEFTQQMIKATGLDPTRATPRICDVQKEIPVPDKSLDALLMGEIVEHLELGQQVMTSMAGKMAPGGRCFFTTAANAPAEDHILLFRTTGEVRSFLKECGWTILREHTGTLNGMSLEEAERDGHNINYAAVIAAQ